MNELEQLRDEIAQLNTALGIKNATIEQLKARVAELEAQQAPSRQVPEGWRELAKQSVEALTLFTGHDSGARLRYRYGDKWWEPLDQLREKLSAMLAAPQAEQQQPVAIMREALTRIASEDYEAPHDASNDYISQRKSACITRMRAIAREAQLQLQAAEKEV